MNEIFFIAGPFDVSVGANGAAQNAT